MRGQTAAEVWVDTLRKSKPNTVKISWGKAVGGRMSRLEVTDTDPNLPSTVWTTVGITSRHSME
jgi:hypothetical protein